MLGNEDAQILVVDDEERMRNLLKKVLAKQGFSVETSSNGIDALDKVERNPFDVIIADIRMPEMNGMDLLKAVRETRPDIYVIIMTAFGSIDSAVEAMKKGAYHYITKPFKMSEISITLKKALEEKRLREEVASLRRELRGKYRFDNLIGKSKPMQDIFDLIRRISNSKSTVMIYGKSGTGKELVAKAVHYNSPRKDKTFVTVNCGAIPETLLESELFGHIKGSFTGAIATRKGLFEEANGGTILLDEIGTISPAMQVKLLRVLQEREIRRVGGTENIKVDIRLIAISNINLEEAVKKGEYREDLYYRLNVITINLPDLKDRQDDISLLANHFLKKYSQGSGNEVKSISKEAMNILLNYDWPGNVRELENAIERAVALGTHEEILPEDLSPNIRNSKKMMGINAILPEDVTIRELEKNYITKILKKTKGHKINTARILGIDRRTLYRKLKKYNLEY
ncbi:MAG: sigma-54 dependent transcriptional regulator [Thermodesulfobacteriota bacterium]|nr:sigma-54 dependent transcriptional regulator [Thermodesulfobacteriota bacterium]